MQFQPSDWDIGTGVRGYAWRAAHPRATLLLQHGFGEYSERYVERYAALVPRLVELGVSVYAFDLDGHGRSPGRRAMTDVDEAVRHHLVARRGLAELGLPVFLFGHSLGGIVTATSVVREPDGVAGVILSSPALLVSANALLRVIGRVAAVALPGMPVRRVRPRDISRLPEQVQAIVDDPVMYHRGMSARLGASVLFTSRRNWAHYPEWTVPTLVLHGTADRITEPEGSRRFVATIASRDRTLHLVEGGYHELLNDVGAEETLRIVLAWLERRLPPAQSP